MKKFRITLEGRVHHVTVEVLDGGSPVPAAAPAAPVAVAAAAPVPSAPRAPVAPGGGCEVRSPLAGKLVSVDVKPGHAVAEGAQVATIEAMKMNTYVFAPRAGTVAAVVAVAGEAVDENDVLLVID